MTFLSFRKQEVLKDQWHRVHHPIIYIIHNYQKYFWVYLEISVIIRLFFFDKWIIYLFNHALVEWKLWVQSCVLHCREVEGEHTGQNICNFIQDMLSNWNITLDRVYVFFLRDNARNIKKAISFTKPHQYLLLSIRFS